MTDKLYDADSYLRSFEAVVLRKIPAGEKELIELDRTAFFPKSGGQPGDVGKIGEAAVKDTFYYEGSIVHAVDAPSDLRVGEEYRCEIDWPVRFRRMQSHTGEHIVSGIAFSEYGAANVGFHMDDLLMTVDFDRPLDKDSLALIEKKANEAVYSDLPVTAQTYSADELALLSYRSKIKAAEDLRLVRIKGVDLCACCAPHVRSTGEIGIIKILSSQSHRGGVRITLKCGAAAYEDYVLKYNNTLESAALLKAKHDEIPQAIREMQQREASLRQTLREASEKYIRQVVSGVEGADGHCVLFVCDADGEELSRIAAAVKDRFTGCCAVFSGDDCKGYSFSILYPNEKYNSFTKQLISSMQGRGGGRGQLIRGSCGSSQAYIRGVFSALPVL